ncbi:Endoglucanase 25 [Linum perenne]
MPDEGPQLQYAATASFLTKLYSDYLELGLQSSVSYILGDNPMKTSYMVGFGKKYPTHVHHRAASIPADGKQYSCSEGDQWKQKKEPNPNTVYGAMVAGPDKSDKFFDDRTKPWFTEPTIVSNAGLVAALIAIHDPPSGTLGSNDRNLGIDQDRIFSNVHLTPPAT